MIPVLLCLLAGAVLVVLWLAFRKPDVFRVQRTLDIAAPPEKIFPYLEDFHRWLLWSPYESKDPAMQRTHSGAASGRGARYEWTGNKKVGSGRMEVLAAEPPASVSIDLHFLTPFENHCTAQFTLTPLPGSGTTRVDWTMQGPAPFVSKLMQVFMNMDQMVGRDFEVGLANLKTLAEK